MLFNSVENISTDRKHGLALHQQIDKLKKVVDENKGMMEEMRSTITTLQTERDTFRDETKDLNQIKTQY